MDYLKQELTTFWQIMFIVNLTGINFVLLNAIMYFTYKSNDQEQNTTWWILELF